MDKLRVLLADDHALVRRGLRMLIDDQSDMEVIGEAGNGREAIALAQQLRPDLVVMDVSMPSVNGLEATEHLRQLDPTIKVLSLTRHSDSGYLQRLLHAGASGYVLKQSADDELLRAIRAVAAGRIYLDPAIAERALGHVTAKGALRGSNAGKTLSAREEQVLRLIARGHIHKEIADVLKISVKTVEAHKMHGMEKLGMKSRVDVVRYAMLEGWLEDT